MRIVERILQAELATAAFVSTTSSQVFNEYDAQLKKIIELLPEPKKLEMEGVKDKEK